jgi:hypothetical protein
MSDNKSYIEVTDKWSDSIKSVSAEVHISVTGENYFWGNAAFEKCSELRELVEYLSRKGLGVDKKSVKEIFLKSESSLMSKSTKAIYRLKIKIDDLSLLGPVLGFLSSSKSIKMNKIDWRYDFQGIRKIGLAIVAASVMGKARIVSEALGQKIIGVKCFSESVNFSKNQESVEFESDMMVERSVRRSVMADSGSIDMGIPLMNENEITINVKLEVYVGPITP